ncbi:glycoside hydrolase family 99-like domain-containing protein [Pseudomonas sp. xss_2]|uniref:glycoside hydrolase family 99-like domain-containing protein n=1 Tax=Pseudomonas sp. xss_2 TaxID=3367215 RepID=UPI00370CCCA2
MPKVLAFYLPQYHPIPENNEWWGEGFTEWNNVAPARPRFDGHYQPHIPADLGFYDLRVAETRQKQASLAAEYGVDGFCYYHYWFNGRRLLERPLFEVLKSNSPTLPFCICWANENWTRAWDGLDRQVLMSQDYTAEDSDAHITCLLEYFSDNRYIKINGRPLFLVYRPDHIPNASSYFAEWNSKAESAGFPGLYICAVKNGFVELSDKEILNEGYDAIVDFQPDRRDFPIASSRSQVAVDLARKVLPNTVYQYLKTNVSAVNRIDYTALVEGVTKKEWPQDYRKYPCVFPSWDNTARRKTPTVIQNLEPETYGRWLKYALESVSQYPEDESFVFINAWNEWAEGCHLEPDKKMGRAFLEVTKRTVGL